MLAWLNDNTPVSKLSARSSVGDGGALGRLIGLLVGLGEPAKVTEVRARWFGPILGRSMVSRGDEAVTDLRARAETGSRLAELALIWMLAQQGDDDAVAELRARATAGDVVATERLAEVLSRRGDDSAVAELRSRADAGDQPAAKELAELLVGRGDEAGLRQDQRGQLG